MRSLIFRTIVIRRRNEKSAIGEKDKLLEEDIKDSDEDDEDKIEVDDDDQLRIDDFFIDFDCSTEVFRAKKKAL